MLLTRPHSFKRKAQLPFYIVLWWSIDVDNMFGAKWNLGPKTQINIVFKFGTGRLIIKNTDKLFVNLLAHQYPHSFTADFQLTILVFYFNIEYQPDGLSSTYILTFDQWWNPEIFGVFQMGFLC